LYDLVGITLRMATGKFCEKLKCFLVEDKEALKDVCNLSDTGILLDVNLYDD